MLNEIAAARQGRDRGADAGHWLVSSIFWPTTAFLSISWAGAKPR